MTLERIGIYGGSFSPPHQGHRRMAEAFLRAERLDRCLVIPTYEPPHKELSSAASPEQRLAMCRLAFAGLPLEVSDLEVARGGKSYTAVTLETLKREGRTLVFLCGTDMFMTMDRWYQPEKIFALAEIVYACRESGEAARAAREVMDRKAGEYAAKYGAICRPMPFDALELSSTDVRLALSDGRNTEGMLDPLVREYIDTWKLYRN